jgi:hypothetical protein
VDGLLDTGVAKRRTGGPVSFIGASTMKQTDLDKQLPVLGMCALLMLCLFLPSVDVAAKTINFMPDNSVILNPERGLAKQMIVGDGSIDELSELRGDNHTVAWGIIRLDAFRTTPVLPGSTLNEFRRWFEEVRASRVKSVLRIVYHQEESFDPQGAIPAIQEAHLTQLGAAVFTPYKDVIIALQAGGIGAYGEWFYAQPGLTNSAARKRLLDKMFAVVPDDAFVMVRTPYYKLEYEAEGGENDRVYRTAHYNDCLLSNADDTGTYACHPWPGSCPAVSSLQSDVANDSAVVPVGGETCNSTPLNDCAETLNGMAYYGYSFINTLWFSSIRSKWEAQGCFDTIAAKLGYRYELITATVPDSLVAGSDFTVSVTLKNTGWAPMYHARPVYIRLMDASGTELAYFWTGAESRNWLANEQEHTLTNTFRVPENVQADSVSLSLWMPDSNPDNYTIPEYAVQFANQGVWDSANGNNILATNIPVVVGSSCGGEATLRDGQWAMLSLPCESPAGTTVGDLFGDDITIGGDPAVYGRDWQVYVYDPLLPSASRYVDPGVSGTLAPGQGIWVIQQTGDDVILDLPSGSRITSTDSASDAVCQAQNGCVPLSLSGAPNDGIIWHLLGNPLPFGVVASDLRVSTPRGSCGVAQGGCSPTMAAAANVVDHEFWHYSEGRYVALTGAAEIAEWAGFWAAELPAAANNRPVLHIPVSATN